LDAQGNSILEDNIKPGTFRLKKGVSFYFYSSLPPCGDASIYDIENKKSLISDSHSRKRRLDDKMESLKKHPRLNFDNSSLKTDDINRLVPLKFL